MPSKSLNLPVEIAKAFIKDMRAYFSEPNAIKLDEIAARQLDGQFGGRLLARQ